MAGNTLDVLFGDALLAAKLSDDLFLFHKRPLVAHILAFCAAFALAAAGAEHFPDRRELFQAVRHLLHFIHRLFDLFHVRYELTAVRDAVLIADLGRFGVELLRTVSGWTAGCNG